MAATGVDSAAVAAALSNADNTNWWKPVVKELQALDDEGSIADHSLLYIFIMGFIGGLLALVMPCIWPIIPMTISFFLKRAKDDKQKGIKDAVTYGLSIVVIYLALGLHQHEAHPDAGEYLNVERHPLKELWELHITDVIHNFIHLTEFINLGFPIDVL